MTINQTRRPLSRAPELRRLLPFGVPVFSGIAFSLNQFFWIRKVGMTLGHTAGSLAAVLAAGSLGLAIGGLWARYFRADRPSEAIRAGVHMQMGAALACLALNAFLLRGGLFFPSMVKGTAAGAVAGWSIALIILAVPSTFFGAALPLTAAAAARSSGLKPESSWRGFLALQAAGNCLGAALFLWLLPAGGESAVALTALVVQSIGALLARAGGGPVSEGNAIPRRGLTTEGGPPWRARGVIFLASASAALAEMAWARSMPVALGSTAMVRALVCVASSFWFSLGGWAAAKMSLSESRAWIQWSRSLLGAAVGLGFYSTAINRLPFLQVVGWPIAVGSVTGPLLLFLLTSLLVAVPAFFMGTAFTLGATNGGARISPVSGALAAGALGSVAGAMTALFVLLPGGGPPRALGASVGLFAVTAFLMDFSRPPVGLRGAAILGVAALSWIGLQAVDDRMVLSGASDHAPIYKSITSFKDFRDLFHLQKILFDEEGFTSRVTVLETPSGVRSLRVDGRAEFADRSEATAFQNIARLPLRWLSTPPRAALVIGLGGGATAGVLTSLPGIERVDVVEIEPRVLNAAPFFASVNGEFWKSPAFRLVPGDARRFLAETRRRYDFIAAQPSPVWISGAGSLYTREALTLVRRCLTDRGMYCQWLNAYGMETRDIKTLAKTFQSVFPHSILVRLDRPHLLLVGFPGPSMPGKGAIDPPAPRQTPFQVLTEGWGKMVLLDEGGLRAWAREGEIYTDARPYLEFLPPSTLQRGVVPLGLDSIGTE